MTIYYVETMNNQTDTDLRRYRDTARVLGNEASASMAQDLLIRRNQGRVNMATRIEYFSKLENDNPKVWTFEFQNGQTDGRTFLESKAWEWLEDGYTVYWRDGRNENDFWKLLDRITW